MGLWDQEGRRRSQSVKRGAAEREGEDDQRQTLLVINISHLKLIIIILSMCINQSFLLFFLINKPACKSDQKNDF